MLHYSAVLSRSVMLVVTTLLVAGSLRPGRAAESFPAKIDQLIDSACRRTKTQMADLCSDAEFVRRVHLDLVGVVPTVEGVKFFLDDSAADKRSRLVDELLASPEFALQMARVFDTMLIERRVATIPSYDVEATVWRDWLAESFRQNKSWDQLVRQLLGNDGTDETNGAAAKFYLVRDVESHLVARDIGRLMLGTDLQCAQCHDDPRIEAYRQADYYGLYAFVSRLDHFRNDDKKLNFVMEKAQGNVSFTSAFTGSEGATNPRLPNGHMIPDPPLAKDKEYKVQPDKNQMGVPAYSRRALLAELLPRRETKGFSLNIANRIWAMMFGRGIVQPLDMHHPDNPPSHPELLRLLAVRLEETGYDVRALLRDIALTRCYQRSSRFENATHEPSERSRFAVAALRPLSPEQLGWSVIQVTGRLASRLARTERKLHEAERKPAAQNVTDADGQTRSDKVSDSQLDGGIDPTPTNMAWQVRKQVYRELRPEIQPLIDVFSRLPGQPDNGFQPSVDQALFLLNSEQMLKSMQNSVLLENLSKTENPEELATDLFLAVLSRRPTDEERDEVVRMVDGVSERKQRYELVRRLVWGHLLSAEFRLNH